MLDVPPKCRNNLTKAVEEGNMRMLRHLLDKGINVNTSSTQDNTTVSSYIEALYIASHYNNCKEC